MYTRRRLLTAGTVGLAAISGCMGSLAGQEPLSQTAEPAAIEQGVLEETGYELAESDTQTVIEEVEVDGETRQIEAINQVVVYERAIDSNELEDELEDELRDRFDEREDDEDDLGDSTEASSGFGAEAEIGSFSSPSTKSADRGHSST